MCDLLLNFGLKFDNITHLVANCPNIANILRKKLVEAWIEEWWKNFGMMSLCFYSTVCQVVVLILLRQWVEVDVP